MAKFPAPTDGIALTHFIVANDVERASRFYSDVLGGEVLREGEPTIIALANSWIIINIGGPPTDDKPTVTLEPPQDPDPSAASSTSASLTSTPSTSSGALAAPNSSPHLPTGVRSSAAICETQTATSSRLAKRSGPERRPKRCETFQRWTVSHESAAEHAPVPAATKGASSAPNGRRRGDPLGRVATVRHPPRRTAPSLKEQRCCPPSNRSCYRRHAVTESRSPFMPAPHECGSRPARGDAPAPRHDQGSRRADRQTGTAPVLDGSAPAEQALPRGKGKWLTDHAAFPNDRHPTLSAGRSDRRIAGRS